MRHKYYTGGEGVLEGRGLIQWGGKGGETKKFSGRESFKQEKKGRGTVGKVISTDGAGKRSGYEWGRQ